LRARSGRRPAAEATTTRPTDRRQRPTPCPRFVSRLGVDGGCRWQTLDPEPPQLAKAAADLTRQLRLVAADGVEAAQVEAGFGIAGFDPFARDEAWWVGVGEQLGLQAISTRLLPEGDGQAVDELGLGRALGFEFVDKIVMQEGEARLVLAFQQDRLGGGEAVLEGVHGGARLPRA
jgi:hypothetical protein